MPESVRGSKQTSRSLDLFGNQCRMVGDGGTIRGSKESLGDRAGMVPNATLTLTQFPKAGKLGESSNLH